MNILAVDQARAGAWSVWDYESQTLVSYGSYFFDPNKYTYEKAIMHIEDYISKVIDVFDVSVVFIEDIQLRANVQAFKKLAQLQGVLVNLLEKNEFLYGVIAPSQWQNYCRARGRNTKEVNSGVLQIVSDKPKSKILSIQFVKDQFGIDTENDNLADALCLGWYVVSVIEIRSTKKKSKSARNKGVK